MDFKADRRLLANIKSVFQRSHFADGYHRLKVASPAADIGTFDESPKPWLAYRFFQLTTVLLSVSTIVLATLYARNLQSPAKYNTYLKDNRLLTCGESVAEAKGLGCHFDLLAKAWLPEACPRHGLAEFASLDTALMNINTSSADDGNHKTDMNHWRYYSAKHGGREISVDELAAMADHLSEDTRYWTTRREHSVHCAWMLLRLAYAYTNGLRGDHMVRSYEHARHCVHNLLDKSMYAPGQDEVATQGNVVFGTC
ncbi:hypothetical protein NLU13_7743 [Sarocladium strictum]|uniref:Uncharacterized protein n=1 Tax=Sarocladium strictum TaxID=5046 RepID=A0AA39GDD5_SARSR|nr:hypothetical protein NLU13_7743 [Sarocladium strictum]